MSLEAQRTSATDWRTLYPFESRFHELGENLRMHYLDEGTGKPLLMVHGNPTWSFYWRNLISDFRSSHRAVAPDHIGCGLSDKPMGYRYCLDQHIDNLCHLIHSLDLRDITLLAHDWGGAIGLGAATALPDRFSRIVLFNTGAFPPPFVPLRIAACRLPMVGRWALQGMNLFARAALSMAVEKPDRMTNAVRAGLLAPYDTWEHRIGIQKFVADIPMTRLHPTWQTLVRLESALPSLAHLPTLMIWGMRDWCFTPACLERLLQSFPQAEVHRLYDCGHYVVEDGFEQIIPLLRQFFVARGEAEPRQ